MSIIENLKNAAIRHIGETHPFKLGCVSAGLIVGAVIGIAAVCLGTYHPHVTIFGECDFSALEINFSHSVASNLPGLGTCVGCALATFAGYKGVKYCKTKYNYNVRNNTD